MFAGTVAGWIIFGVIALLCLFGWGAWGVVAWVYDIPFFCQFDVAQAAVVPAELVAPAPGVDPALAAAAAARNELVR